MLCVVRKGLLSQLVMLLHRWMQGKGGLKQWIGVQSTLKYEEVDRTEYRNLEEAKPSMKEFLEKIYNQKHLHSAFGDKMNVRKKDETGDAVGRSSWDRRS